MVTYNNNKKHDNKEEIEDSDIMENKHDEMLDIFKNNPNFNMHYYNTSIDMLILWYLSKEDLHGYGLKKKIDEFFRTSIENGILKKTTPKKVYFVLNKLEDQGIVDNYPGVHNKKKVKIYRLTDKGRGLIKDLRNSINKHVKEDDERKEFLKFIVGDIS